VVAHALGLNGVDAATVRSWYQAFVVAIFEYTAGRTGDAAEEFGRLRATVRGAIRDAPDSPLGTAARRLPAPEVVSNAAVLMFGGIDMTEGMITNAVLHLLGHTDQLALVRDRPDLLSDAVQESLRLEPAACVVDRYATADVTLEGVRVRAGDLVRVSISAANRDPAIFEEPDRYDIRRAQLDRHLAFAHGPHFCLGAHLARLEAMTVLRALLDLPGLRLERPAAPQGLVFRKPEALYVTWAAPFTL
jgi:cytochrome P450